MANKNYKKAVVFGLCLAMLTPLGSMAVTSADVEEETAAVEETVEEVAEDESTSEDEDKLPDKISNEQAAAMAQKLSENDNFILYGDEENERLGLYVKSTDKYWWTSPINVYADDIVVDPEKGDMMKTALRKQIASSCAIKVGDLRQEKRTESAAPVYSNKARVSWQTNDKGAVITYDYKSEGVKLKVHYELCEDSLYVYVNSAEVEEANISTVDGKILTKLQLCPYFAATPSVDYEGNPTQGYMIIPDGSGAVINYNNGKGNYPDYVQQVYGRDYTMVPLTAPRVIEQAYLPVLSTVYGDGGIVAVVTDGDSNVYTRAQVSGQNKQVYNNCYFEFETRSSDAFFMSGDSANKLNVFEKDGIKTERFGIHYYPVASKDGGMVNYADCAEVYRNYLIKEKGLKQQDTSDNKLYMDMYGGVLKRTSILGLPFNLKTEITGFDQAGEIVDELKGKGVDSFAVNYNDWTNSAIKGNISTSVSPSGTLGGNGDFKDFLATENVDVYPSMNNFTMKKSSAGYWTLTSTAIRISNAYSRQSSYSLSFGVQQKGVAPALLSPSKYSKTFEEMIESYGDEKVDKAGFGYFSTRLVGDYTRKDTYSRNKTMNLLVDEYSKAQNSIGSLIADEANAYVLPYVSTVTGVPVSSSGFDLTDFDIPFYQMVLHGYVPYASNAINKSSNTDETFMLALASGSQIHYDFTYADSDVLQDTEYNDLYYTNYRGWTDAAANQFKASEELLSGVTGYTISNYEVSADGNEFTTTYSKDGQKDVVVVINKKDATASVDGKAVSIENCIEGGLR
ncbi:DUF5696 domain-containing protein [Ruminococcus sp.]|uniref:DUF5696 domain-containing protein n=1 Tax=Ruminococcus sp. TaxID=41978 RepID=UPI0025F9BAFA|nr:DUF5696 domain-containing protein [Ruminococcus sp.]MBQ8967025.1 hypothetical protein [Ruminococcus sp.]